MVNEEKLREILDMFEYEELVKLREDIDENVSFLKKEIVSRISEIENKDQNICVTCGRNIKPARGDNFQLVFGQGEVKRKANFCASDCLEYFVKKLRELDVKVERGIIKDHEDLTNELDRFDEFDEF